MALYYNSSSKQNVGKLFYDFFLARATISKLQLHTPKHLVEQHWWKMRYMTVSTDRLSIPEPSSEEKQDIKNEGACDSRVLVEEVAGLLTPDVGDKRYVVVQLTTKHPSIPDGTTLACQL